MEIGVAGDWFLSLAIEASRTREDRDYFDRDLRFNQRLDN